MSSNVIKFTADIIVTRGSHGKFTIRIGDSLSGAVVEASLTGEQLANALTGMCTDNIPCKALSAERIGSMRVSKMIKAKIPDNYFSYQDSQDRAILKEMKKHVPAGWSMHDSLRGQSNWREEGYCSFLVIKYEDSSYQLQEGERSHGN